MRGYISIMGIYIPLFIMNLQLSKRVNFKFHFRERNKKKKKPISTTSIAKASEIEYCLFVYFSLLIVF